MTLSVYEIHVLVQCLRQGLTVTEASSLIPRVDIRDLQHDYLWHVSQAYSRQIDRTTSQIGVIEARPSTQPAISHPFAPNIGFQQYQGVVRVEQTKDRKS